MSNKPDNNTPPEDFLDDADKEDASPDPKKISNVPLKRRKRKGMTKIEREKRQEMREQLEREALKDTATKLKKPGKIKLSDVGELENVRPEYYDIDKLAESIKEVGLMHPLVIRKAEAPPFNDEEQKRRKKAERKQKKRNDFLRKFVVTSEDEIPKEFRYTQEEEEILSRHGKKFELVSGYRRKRALEILDVQEAMCYLGDYNEQEVLELMISENTQREDLSPIAEARSMKRLMDIFQMNQGDVAQRLGVHRSHVSHRLQLLSLEPKVQLLIDDGKLSASHGEVLQGLDAKNQEKYADKAIKGEIGVNKLSVWVQEVKEGKSTPLDDFDEELRLIPARTTEIGGVILRDDISDFDYKKMLLYGALRNFNDQQLIYLIGEKHKKDYLHLWDYVRELKEKEVDKFLQLMALRFVVAMHRVHSLEKTLIDDLCVTDADGGLSRGEEARKINEDKMSKLAPKKLEFDPNFHPIDLYPEELALPEDKKEEALRQRDGHLAWENDDDDNLDNDDYDWDDDDGQGGDE